MHHTAQKDSLDREVSDLLQRSGQGRGQARRAQLLCTISEDEEDRECNEEVEFILDPVPVNRKQIHEPRSDNVMLCIPNLSKCLEDVTSDSKDVVTLDAEQCKTKLDEPDVTLKPIAQPEASADACRPTRLSRKEEWYQKNGDKIVDEVLQELLPYNPMDVNSYTQSIPTIVLDSAEEDLSEDDSPQSGYIVTTLPDGTEIHQEPDITEVIREKSVIYIKKKRKIKVKLPALKIPVPRPRSPARALLNVTKSIFGFSESDTEDKDSSAHPPKGGARRRLSMLLPSLSYSAPKTPPAAPTVETHEPKPRFSRRSMSWSAGPISRDSLRRLNRISDSADLDNAPPRTRPDPFDDLLKVKMDERLNLSEDDRKLMAVVPYIRSVVFGLGVGCFVALLFAIGVLIIPWDDSKSD